MQQSDLQDLLSKPLDASVFEVTVGHKLNNVPLHNLARALAAQQVVASVSAKLTLRTQQATSSEQPVASSQQPADIHAGD